MINLNGDVIGVNFAAMTDGTMGYTVPVSALKALIRRGSWVPQDYADFLPLLKTTRRNPANATEQRALADLYGAAKPSIFKIRAISKKGDPIFGTAFAVDNYGHFISSESMADNADVRLNHDESWSLKLTPVAKFRGLSVLKADSGQFNRLQLQPLSLDTSPQIIQSARLVAFGYPQAMGDLNISIGLPWSEETANLAVERGFGGAPVMDEVGNVVCSCP